MTNEIVRLLPRHRLVSDDMSRRISSGNPDGGVGLERRLVLDDDLLARLSFDEGDEAAGGLAEGRCHAD
jgi:hypothetical protein